MRNSPELEKLGYALEMIHGLAGAQVLEHIAGTLHGGEMSFSQLNALFRLRWHGPQTIAELAHGADLSHTAASRMVERLVQTGLAVRREGLHDRRQKQVELTPMGADKLERLRQLTAESYISLLAPVPEAITGRLQDVLEEIEPFLPECCRSAPERMGGLHGKASGKCREGLGRADEILDT